MTTATDRSSLRVAGIPGTGRARLLWRQLKGHRVARRLAGPKLLEAFADAYEQPFFIEIGSNDGDQHDPLKPLILSRSWRGIMVEPVPFVFARLRDNYGDLPQLALENAAIADRDGTLPFYHLAEVTAADREGLPRWYDGIGSFSREQVLSHRPHIPDIDSRVVCTDVPVMTFESLCRKHTVDRLDLLLIDTERHDAEIVRSIDFSSRRPALLVYEHFHLPESDRVECRSLLHRHGYETMEEGLDTWCVDPAASRPLTKVWERLRPGIPGVSAHDRA
jgi:FkbM family methyltransferase